MQTLIEARARVKKQGIQKILKLYHVRDRKSLMLHVLFNIMYSEGLEKARSTNDIDYKDRLQYQRAVFELASED